MGTRYGQNFLKDEGALQRIADALEIQSDDLLIEIGPGHGELTENILKRKVLKLILIEKDPSLIPGLHEKFGNENMEILEGDALQILPKILNENAGKSIKLVGNIPYYITGFLFRKMGESEKKPDFSVFTIQKEVAERICSLPPEMNRLAASIQIWAEPKLLFKIPKSSFSPKPKVDSAVISLKTRDLSGINLSKYFEVMHALFQQPRKTILNNLLPLMDKKNALKSLNEANIDSKARPQNLDVNQIRKLAELVGRSS